MPRRRVNYSELPGFIAAALALLGSPGPATLSLAAAGAAYSVKDCRTYLIGLTIGGMLVVVGVAAGLLTAVLAVPFAARVLTVISFAYLAYIAYKIASAPPVGDGATVADAPGFMTGLVLNLSNPKAYAAFAALFSGFDVMPQAPVYSTMFKALALCVILSIINPTWLFAGNALRHYLQDRRVSRLINIGFAVLLLLSVVAALMVSGF